MQLHIGVHPLGIVGGITNTLRVQVVGAQRLGHADAVAVSFFQQRRIEAPDHGTAAERSPSLWSTNVATSTDLIHWKKYPNNPLLPIEANKSSGILVHDGRQFRLYTMHDTVHLHFPK